MRTYGKDPNHWAVKFFEFNGERRTLSDWAKRMGLSYECVQSRFRHGIPLDRPKSRAGRPLAKRWVTQHVKQQEMKMESEQAIETIRMEGWVAAADRIQVLLGLLPADTATTLGVGGTEVGK
jgi:hypothetical protein